MGLHPGYQPGHKAWSALEAMDFPRFVDMVLQQHNSGNCSSKPFSKKCKIDAHWKPQYMQCFYCEMNYDVIGKVETFEEDFLYIVRRQNLTHHFPKSQTLRKFHPTYKTLENVEYFKQLSRGQVQQLYKMYELDFLLFNYDASNYL